MRQAYKSNAKSATPSASNQSAVGNPGEGTPATIIGDRWFWLATETIKRVIEEGGITPGDDPDELKDAILALVAGTSGLDTTAGDNCGTCSKLTTFPTWTTWAIRGTTSASTAGLRLTALSMICKRQSWAAHQTAGTRWMRSTTF